MQGVIAGMVYNNLCHLDMATKRDDVKIAYK